MIDATIDRVWRVTFCVSAFSLSPFLLWGTAHWQTIFSVITIGIMSFGLQVLIAIVLLEPSMRSSSSRKSLNPIWQPTSEIDRTQLQTIKIENWHFSDRYVKPMASGSAVLTWYMLWPYADFINRRQLFCRLFWFMEDLLIFIETQTDRKNGILHVQFALDTHRTESHHHFDKGRPIMLLSRDSGEVRSEYD